MENNNSLQHELWIAELGRSAEVEYATSEMLWKALIQQLQIRLDRGETVSIAGIGAFCINKSTEYIAELPDGKRYLIPPRINLLLTPEQKNATQNLLPEALAGITGFTSTVCSKWWMAISSVFKIFLSEKSCVLWSGIGAFTAEQSTPGSPSGYTFLPNGELPDFLNRSFSMFEPVEVATGYDVPDTAVLTVSSLDMLSGYTTSYILWTTEEIPEESKELQPAEIIANRLPESNLFVETEQIDESNNETKDNALPSPKEVVHTDTEIQESHKTTLKKDEITEGQPLQKSFSKTIIEPAPPKKNRKAVYWSIAGILLLLAVSFLIYQTVIEQQKKQKKNTPAKELPKRTPAMEVKKPADPVPNPLTETAPEKKHWESLATTKIKEGDRLASYARKFYGHKAFWIYIYEENKDIIKDPNNIPIGVEIKIPMPDKYGIDASDTISIQKALSLERTEYKIWHKNKTP